MFDKDNLTLGLAIGLALPLIGFLVIYFGYMRLEETGVVSEPMVTALFRERTASIIAICLNVIPLNLFQRNRVTQSMRGIVLATGIYIIAWIIYFGRYLL